MGLAMMLAKIKGPDCRPPGNSALILGTPNFLKQPSGYSIIYLKHIHLKTILY